MNESVRCEVCGLEIKGYLGLDVDFKQLDIDEQIFPAILHPKCYREISEKAWAYDNLG
jgi:hypothetical protein